MLPFPILTRYGNTLIRRRIEDMQSSNTHSLILLSTGEMYGRGSGSNNIIGTGSATSNTFVLVQSNVQSMVCGSGFTLYVQDGVLYRLGIGLTYSTGTTSTPVVIPTPFNARNIKKIQCIGSSSCVVLLTDGTMYFIGSGESGRFGNGKTDTIKTFTLSTMTDIKDMYHKVQTSEGSTGNTVILKNDGTVYGCGSIGTSGGFFRFSSYQKSTEWIQRMNTNPCYRLCSTGMVVLVLDINNNLYADGNNNYEIMGTSNYSKLNYLLGTNVKEFGANKESTYFTCIGTPNILSLAGSNSRRTSSFSSAGSNQARTEHKLSSDIRKIYDVQDGSEGQIYMTLEEDGKVVQGGLNRFPIFGNAGITPLPIEESIITL